jgi:hypothetical protein
MISFLAQHLQPLKSSAAVAIIKDSIFIQSADSLPYVGHPDQLCYQLVRKRPIRGEITMRQGQISMTLDIAGYRAPLF